MPGINYILQYITIKNSSFNSNRILQYFSFYCIFDQINAALENLVKKTILDRHMKVYLNTECDWFMRVY